MYEMLEGQIGVAGRDDLRSVVSEHKMSESLAVSASVTVMAWLCVRSVCMKRWST
jgi:hypothetical protein